MTPPTKMLEEVIIIDACHRSIYNLWRQVLDYFAATMVNRTCGFSQQTLSKGLL